MTTPLSEAHKKLFAACWKKEYAATLKLNSLREASDRAYQRDLPTARLENQIQVWQRKQNDACDPLIPLIESGVLGQDATVQCASRLGEISGYVADCYYSMWLDHKPAEQAAE